MGWVLRAVLLLLLLLLVKLLLLLLLCPPGRRAHEQELQHSSCHVHRRYLRNRRATAEQHTARLRARTCNL